MTSTEYMDAIAMANRRGNLEDTEHTRAYRDMLTAVRKFQDAVVQANPSQEQLTQMTTSLNEVRSMLETQSVPEHQRWYGRGRGGSDKLQVLTPQLAIDYLDEERMEAHTVAGEFYIGMNSAMHGGVVAAIFDALLGRMSVGKQRLVSRTAYLTTHYRAITPLNQRLDLAAKVESIQGRKRFISGQLWHGDTLCAEADALFVEMLPGQQ